MVLTLAGAAVPAAAQWRVPPPQEPQLLTLHLDEASVGLYSEGEFESDTFPQSNISATEDHLFLGPMVGMSLDGSIYHPNLLRFTFNGQLAAGLGELKVGAANSSYTENQIEYLGNFGAAANILANKPFNATLFGSYGRTYSDYDNFNRVWMTGWHYGGRLNYSSGPWVFSGGYTHSDLDTTALSGNYSTIQDIVDATGSYARQNGSTRFNYTYDQNRYNDQTTQMNGYDQTVALGDHEQFGSLNQYQLNSSASYALNDYLNDVSRQADANVTFTGLHNHHLSSSLSLAYDNFSQDTYNSATYSAQGQIQHQLFDSLTSTLSLSGADNEASDQNISGYTRSYGAGLSENYHKKLSRDSALSISQSLYVEHDDQQTTGTVKNEQHTFAADGTFTLNVPNVITTSIVIYQNNGQPPFQLGLDYFVSGTPSHVVITRLDGGRIPAGATVLVNYNTNPTVAGSFDTMTEAFQVRLNLWRKLLAVYGRLNLFLNNAPQDLNIPNVADYTAGTELNWRWLGGGAEYELYSSQDYSYTAERLFQSASFSPEAGSSLSLNLSETWLDYSQTHQQQVYYLALARYHRVLTHRLGLDLNAGLSYRSGAGIDETLAVARVALNYVIGKTSINASYDYNYDAFLNAEQQQRHMFFLTIKRVF
jgi:hypothetical protein